MTSHEIAERGFRAQQAWDEFVGPAFEAIHADYLAGLARVAADEPWSTDKIVKLSIASRVIEKVQEHMRAAMFNGALEARNIARAAEIEALPERKKRWLK